MPLPTVIVGIARGVLISVRARSWSVRPSAWRLRTAGCWMRSGCCGAGWVAGLPERVTDAEMVEILEDLARNGGDSAKVAAIRVLRATRAEEAEEKPSAVPDEFARLYEIQDPASRRKVRRSQAGVSDRWA